MTIKIPITVMAALTISIVCSPVAAGPLEDGEAAIRKGDYPAALVQFLPLAERGDRQAQYELGRIYESGYGVAKDEAKAANWYQKSSASGDHQAQFLLAFMYARGGGVSQDGKKGLYWLTKAIESDPAQKQVAERLLYFITLGSYENGRRLSPSELTARALPKFQDQADQGDADAKCVLLQIYERGQAAPRPSDDLAALKSTCTEMSYQSTGRPPPPGITVGPSRTPN